MRIAVDHARFGGPGWPTVVKDEFGVRPSGYPIGMRPVPAMCFRTYAGKPARVRCPLPANLRDTYLTRCGTTATWQGGNRWDTTSPPTHLIGVSVSSPSRTA